MAQDDDNNGKIIDTFMTSLGWALVTALLLLLLLASGCRSSRVAVTEQRSDSTRVEVRERTVLVKDTVFVALPEQSRERVTADSVSYLETDVAYSRAELRQDGTLLHTLHNRDRPVAVETNGKVTYRDSIVYRDRTISVDREVEVEVRKLTWWDKTQIYGFWAVLGVVALYLSIKRIKKLL